MKVFLAGSAVGSAICYGLFGDTFFMILAFTLAVSSLAFLTLEEIGEQD